MLHVQIIIISDVPKRVKRASGVTIYSREEFAVEEGASPARKMESRGAGTTAREKHKKKKKYIHHIRDTIPTRPSCQFVLDSVSTAAVIVIVVNSSKNKK